MSDKTGIKISRAALAALAAAIFSLASAAGASAQSAADFFKRGVELHEDGLLDEAAAQVSRAIELEPSNAYFKNEMGLIQLDMGKFDDAVATLARAVELDPKLAAAHSGLGVAYNAKNEYTKSIESFRKALELTPPESPDISVIHNNIGQTHYLLRNFAEAETELRRALELDPELLTAHINLGNVYTERGDFATAVKFHEQAVKIAPDYALPRNNLAYAYYKVGRFDDAIREMEQVIKRDPQNPQFKKNYQFIKAEKERHEQMTHREGPLKGLPKEVSMKPKGEAEAAEKAAPAPVPMQSPTSEAATAPATETKPAPAAPAPVVEEKKPEPAPAPAAPATVVASAPAPVATEEKKTAPAPAPARQDGPAKVVVAKQPEPAPAPKAETKPAPAPVVEEKKSEPVPAPVVVEEKKPEPAPAASGPARVVAKQPEPAPAPAVEEKKPEPAPVVVAKPAPAPVIEEKKPEPAPTPAPVAAAPEPEEDKPVLRQRRPASEEETQAEPAKVAEQKKAEPVSEAKPKAAEPEKQPEYERAPRVRGTLSGEEREEQKLKEFEMTAEERAAEYYRAARYNLSVKDVEKADRDIQRALEIHPADADYLTVSGLVAAERGRIHEAAVIFRSVLEKSPAHSVARNSLGYVNLKLNRPELAVEDFSAAKKADENDGCAAANLASMLVFAGKCDEAAGLLEAAVSRGCPRPGPLNSAALCMFRSGDIEGAQERAYRALELDPRNDTLASNFSYIVQKSGIPFNPVKISVAPEFTPYARLSESDREVSLKSLTPLVVLDFYEVFKSVYHKKTILALPFENPRGTERWNPAPADVHTDKLAASLRETGYFRVVVPEEDLSRVPYKDRSSEQFIKKMLAKYPADIVYVGNLGRQQLTDVKESKYMGLKKVSLVEGSQAVQTKILLVETGLPLYDGEMKGAARADGMAAATPYREAAQIKLSAFDDYCAGVANVIMDHYNLVRYPVRQDVVKYIDRELKRGADYRR
jgi:tetratricopeptide (TPR) repeat protein